MMWHISSRKAVLLGGHVISEALKAEDASETGSSLEPSSSSGSSTEEEQDDAEKEEEEKKAAAAGGVVLCSGRVLGVRGVAS